MDAASYPLRALNIGEIFDRAITIYIRNIVPLTLMVMTLVVPLGVAQVLVAPDQAQTLTDAIRQIQNPSSVHPMNGREFGLIILVGLAALFLIPVVNSAVAVGVASIYNGRAPSYARSFGVVLRHIWPLLGATLLFFGIGLGLYVLFVIIAAVIFGIAIAITSAFLPLAIVLYVFLGISLLAFLFAIVLLVMALAFATYSTVIESKGTIAAVSLALRRLLSRREIGKAMLMALAYFALYLGITMLSTTVSLLFEFLTHSVAVGVAVRSLISAATGAAVTVLTAVYYYDVRTRSEGLDLEVELAQLTAP